MKTDIQAESMWLRKDKYAEDNHTKPEANESKTKPELGENSLHTTQRTRQPTTTISSKVLVCCLNWGKYLKPKKKKKYNAFLLQNGY